MCGGEEKGVKTTRMMKKQQTGGLKYHIILSDFSFLQTRDDMHHPCNLTNINHFSSILLPSLSFSLSLSLSLNNHHFDIEYLQSEKKRGSFFPPEPAEEQGRCHLLPSHSYLPHASPIHAATEKTNNATSTLSPEKPKKKAFRCLQLAQIRKPGPQIVNGKKELPKVSTGVLWSKV